jgi:hypothetical protein
MQEKFWFGSRLTLQPSSFAEWLIRGDGIVVETVLSMQEKHEYHIVVRVRIRVTSPYAHSHLEATT